FVKTVGLRRCFLTGWNSTLRQHCWRHYKIYQMKCEEVGIPMNHHAIPPKLVKVQEKQKKE
ncbi:hypothetical protein EDB85DRAFT_1821841, partial [Lactarius pseudohatsudake]